MTIIAATRNFEWQMCRRQAAAFVLVLSLASPASNAMDTQLMCVN